MIPNLLYKYLDFDGGLKMLKYHNFQFTNATKLNDPFDCHPGLINFSDVPEARCKIWPANIITLLESSPYKRSWEETWICSLSKVFDELLMWSYYSSHKGVCIGLDIEKADKYLSRVMNGPYIGTEKLDVNYKNIREKPDYFRDIDVGRFFHYQLSTKAKAWEHEQEVRLLLRDPSCGEIPCAEPEGLRKSEDEAIDYKELRFYPPIGKECFCSLYLGVSMEQEKQDEIMKVARWLNPEMKIYKMTVDPDAFRLKPEPVL